MNPKPLRQPELRVVPDEPAVIDEAAELSPVVPQAPLDVRAREAVAAVLQSRPRWSERPPSTAEVWEWSNTGDWTTDDNSARRVVHGVCVLAAFVVTYPVDWAVRVARSKPAGFLLILVVLFVLSKIV